MELLKNNSVCIVLTEYFGMITKDVDEYDAFNQVYLDFDIMGWFKTNVMQGKWKSDICLAEW